MGSGDGQLPQQLVESLAELGIPAQVATHFLYQFREGRVRGEFFAQFVQQHLPHEDFTSALGVPCAGLRERVQMRLQPSFDGLARLGCTGSIACVRRARPLRSIRTFGGGARRP